MKKLLIWALLILTGGSIVSAQQLETPEQTEKRVNAILERDRKILAAYTKSSSVAAPIDAGNKIVAIRRIHYFTDSLKDKNRNAANFIKLIEIELRAAVLPPIYMNCCNAVAFIGNLIRPQVLNNSSAHNLFIRLPEEEFDQLRGGEIVSVAVLSGSYDGLQQLKVSAAKEPSQGVPKIVRGVKFGRLAKKAANQFPLIEEDQQLFNQRIYGIRAN